MTRVGSQRHKNKLWYPILHECYLQHMHHILSFVDALMMVIWPKHVVKTKIEIKLCSVGLD